MLDLVFLFLSDSQMKADLEQGDLNGGYFVLEFYEIMSYDA